MVNPVLCFSSPGPNQVFPSSYGEGKEGASPLIEMLMKSWARGFGLTCLDVRTASGTGDTR